VANELILVVEDNGMSRKLVRDLLTVKGYEISTPRREKRVSAASYTSSIEA
jgi:CheY-like chemotaxis protein